MNEEQKRAVQLALKGQRADRIGNGPEVADDLRRIGQCLQDLDQMVLDGVLAKHPNGWQVAIGPREMTPEDASAFKQRSHDVEDMERRERMLDDDDDDDDDDPGDTDVIDDDGEESEGADEKGTFT